MSTQTRRQHLEEQARQIQSPLPDPPLPPLTAGDFRDACGHRHRGLAVVDNEDGDVFTYGHHPFERFAAAGREHEAELVGDLDEEDQINALDVVHRWAVTVVEPGEFGEWQIDWRTSITEGTPGAFPLTVANR